MKYDLPDRVFKEITAFALKSSVNKVILFGSRAKGTNTDRSDVDIAVYGGDFDSFYWDRYDYVKFIGTLEYTGTYWNVNVDGATAHVGSIMSPDQDLTAFIGKKVLVGGWFCGFSGSNGKFLNIVLREISEPSTDGSTEDVTPGDDLLPDDSSK